MDSDSLLNSLESAIANDRNAQSLCIPKFFSLILIHASGKYQAYGLVFSVELLEIKIVENVLIGPIPLQAQKSNSQKHEFDANSARVLIPGF